MRDTVAGMPAAASSRLASGPEGRTRERLLTEQANLLERIAIGDPLAACLTELTAAIGRLGEDVRAAVLLADDERRQIGAAFSAHLPPAFGAAIRGAPIGPSPIGTCGTAIHTGTPVSCTDIAGRHVWAPQWKALCLAHGVAACHSTPVFSTDGVPVASLFLCFGTARPAGEWDMRVAEFGAHVAAVALERDRQARALRESDRRKDEFIATLAHELRNPLAPLRNALQVLGLTHRAEPVHLMMERQVQHLVRLVDDLLDISRISRGRIELRCEPLDLRDVLSQVLDVTAPQVAAAGHRLDAKVALKPLPLRADAVRLAQVFTNLIDNAIKYTPAGGHLQIDATNLATEAEVTVRDSGAGIPAEMLERVFEPFAQVDRTLKRARGGLGIGLSLARSLVQLHGGTIVAHSAGPGRGSEFVVRLPLAESAGRAEAALASRAVPTGPSPPALRRVLVVDDNRDAAEALCSLLRVLGAETQAVHDGEAALAQFEAWQPGAVFLDLGMPGMDGFEVARQIRARAKHAVTLIAASGWGREADRARTAAAGFDHHLVKPVDAGALSALLGVGVARLST